MSDFGLIEAFINSIADGITVDWPHQHELLVTDSEGDLTLNPLFDHHISRYENWKMRRSWAKRYPGLVSYVSLSDYD